LTKLVKYAIIIKEDFTEKEDINERDFRKKHIDSGSADGLFGPDQSGLKKPPRAGMRAELPDGRTPTWSILLSGSLRLSD